VSKSAPWTNGPETDVVPSDSKISAVTAEGATSQVPPVAPSGSWSVIVGLQAGAPPAFWTSNEKVSGVPTVMVAGPSFVRVSSGSTTVMGSLVPGSPGSSLLSSSSIRS
jgi:hypothetical protein